MIRHLKIFSLFESILMVDPKFIEILNIISANDKKNKVDPDIAGLLLDLIGKRDIKTNLNYIKPGKLNDEILFVNDTQVKRIIDQGQNPFDKANSAAKIGRSIRQILQSDNVDVSEALIADFVNKYKNA